MVYTHPGAYLAIVGTPGQSRGGSHSHAEVEEPPLLARPAAATSTATSQARRTLQPRGGRRTSTREHSRHKLGGSGTGTDRHGKPFNSTSLTALTFRGHQADNRHYATTCTPTRDNKHPPQQASPFPRHPQLDDE